MHYLIFNIAIKKAILAYKYRSENTDWERLNHLCKATSLPVSDSARFKLKDVNDKNHVLWTFN